MRDPDWGDQLIPLSLVSGVVGLVSGLVTAVAWGVLAGLVTLLVGLVVVGRFFDRRLLVLDGDTLTVDGPEGHLEIAIKSIAKIETFEVFHVGKQVTITAGQTSVSDLEPSASGRLLRALGTRLVELGMTDVCMASARKYLGL